MGNDKANISLEEIKNETVDLEKIPIEEVFEQLKCSREGLTSDEGTNRINIFGPNKLKEKKESKLLKFLGFMWNPLSWVMEAAAIMAIALANGDGKPPDWQDFFGIVCLLVINSTISFIEENNAGNSAAALMANLAPKTKVLRDGKWSEQEAAILVPGDIISIKLGDIVPADVRLLEGDPLKVDQSALTGESLPVTRGPGDEVFSGSTCKQGEIEAVVIGTGVHTFFGKAAHLVDSTNQVGHFQKVLTAIGNFCICSIAIGMLIELVVMYPIQRRKYRDGIDNLLVLLIGGIPIAMPTVLSVTMAIGSHRLSQQGAITKRMTAIEEMAGMDILCSAMTGTLTLNKLSLDKTLIEVFCKGVDKEQVVLFAARASRVENQDAIDAAIVGMLADPREVRAGLREVHFLPFNPVDKRTALTYIDSNGDWHRVSKGAPEQILTLCNANEDMKKKAHAIIDKFADRGLRSLGVSMQTVPEKTKESPGAPWTFVGLLPLFDPPRQDSAETIKRALNLGVNVKMITGDQLAIAKETGRRLGMGTNMYPSASLLGNHKDSNIKGLPVEELIEKADGFAGVFPEHKYEIVKKLQESKHIVGMTGDGVNDAPALKKADIGIAVVDATEAARSASDIVLTEPGLSVIISAVLTSRAIFQRMKNYTIYAVSITIRSVFGFMFIALFWKFDFSPFMVLIIAILNDGTIMTISKDRVKPSPLPDSWKLKEIFATGVVLGGYLALMTVFFFWTVYETDFFSHIFGVRNIRGSEYELMAALYLQVSIVSQALIFVTRSRGWSFLERPGFLLVIAFFIAQLIATLIAVYANWEFARIKGIGWGWAAVIWLYNIVFYIPLDLIKIAFTTNKDYGREAQWAHAQRTLHGLQREAQLAHAQRTLHGLQPPALIDKFLNEIEREKPIRFTSHQLKIATDNFNFVLGSGGFGTVYKGVFSNGTLVAVKVLYGNSNKTIEQQFMAEVSTIGTIHHFNLVRLYGFCFEKDVIALVYEYMGNGSLDRYLFHNSNNVLGFEKLHEIAVGIARGIAYLHEECQQRIVHYDIKPGNILLDSKYNPKVADFGLAKLYNRENTHMTMTGGRGTPGYAAPELWMPYPITHKCDVYSFGMLLFEIVGRRKNLDSSLSSTQEWFPRCSWKKYENQNLGELFTIIGNEIEEKDTEIAERTVKVALWCVQYNAQSRPSMSSVVKMLEGAVDIPLPILNPFQYLEGATHPGPANSTWTGSSEFGTSGTVTKCESETPIMRQHEIELASV